MSDKNSVVYKKKQITDLVAKIKFVVNAPSRKRAQKRAQKPTKYTIII